MTLHDWKMLKDVEQLCERINIPKSSTQRASGTINGTNTETSKAKSSEEAHAISLTSIDSVFCGRSVSLAFVNRAASFFKCSYCWADAWKCWELGGLALGAARVAFGFWGSAIWKLGSEC